jgi:aryl-alcohol dehydrogenase-like predicted oxidoreductase
MHYRQLGSSDLRISKIGFGCMSLEANLRQNEQMIHKAIECGINFFDTADLYQKGDNESILGAAIKPFRKKIIIATKVGNQWRNDGSGWDWNPNRKYILKAVEESLRRLQTNYIDLYQLHGGTMDDPIDEIIETFESLKQQGKIRYYGISSIRPNVIREYISRSGIVSVMMQYSLLDRRPEESCIGLLEEHNIGILARGALAKGLLAGKPSSSFLNYNGEQVAKVAMRISSLSGPQRSKAQTALQFVLRKPVVTSVVAGIRTMEQLNDITGVFESVPLSTEELSILENLLPLNYYEGHR